MQLTFDFLQLYQNFTDILLIFRKDNLPVVILPKRWKQHKENRPLLDCIPCDTIAAFDIVGQLQIVIFQKPYDIFKIIDDCVSADLAYLHEVLYIQRMGTDNDCAYLNPVTLIRCKDMVVITPLITHCLLYPSGLFTAYKNAFTAFLNKRIDILILQPLIDFCDIIIHTAS